VLLPVEEVVLPVSSLSTSVTGKLITLYKPETSI
jgi:hypothetical protein